MNRLKASQATAAEATTESDKQVRFRSHSPFVKPAFFAGVGAIAKDYFDIQIEFVSPEIRELVRSQQVILFANHSGMGFPWDGILLMYELARLCPEARARRITCFAAPILFQSRLMNLMAVPGYWRRFDNQEASLENFAAALEQGDSIYINPEGIPGIAKGFAHRYRLQRLSRAFARMAIQYQIPLVPVYCINAEYFHPFSRGFPWLNKLSGKFGIPFLPLSPLLPLILLFPFMLYFAFPTRPKLFIGEPFQPLPANEGSSTKNIKTYVTALAQTYQERLTELARLHGGEGKPSAAMCFFRLVEWRKIFSLRSPLFWAYYLHSPEARPELRTLRPVVRGCLRALLYFGFVLPVLGWPLLYLVHRWEIWLGLPVTEPFLYKGSRL